jgi:DNA-nicking Smr family endonuclease
VNEDGEIDPDILRRMMMGDFSSSFSDKKKPTRAKEKNARKVEFDLHFENLYPTKASLSTGEKLKLQLEALDDFLIEAKKKSTRHAYIIVGKGEGVLRKEVKRKLIHSKIKHSEVADPPYFGNAIKISL